MLRQCVAVHSLYCPIDLTPNCALQCAFAYETAAIVEFSALIVKAVSPPNNNRYAQPLPMMQGA